jgi:hypothetical protein
MFAWVLFILLGPYYLVGNGLPQPGDWLVVLLTPLALASWNGRLSVRHSRTVKALFVFTVWVALVNWGWATVLWKWNNKFDYLLHPVFYAFNAAVFLSALIIARRDPRRFLRITVDIVFVTILAMAVMSTIGGSSSGRTAVFFNSPNQTGYYSLLSACLFALTQRPLGISRLRAGISISLCAYIALLTASRASLAGIALLVLVLVVSDPKAVIIGTIAAFALSLSAGERLEESLEFNQKRALEQRDQQGFARERGYDRIWRFPEYLVLGAGEGDNRRFAEEGYVPRELHSSFGSLLFSYGVVGMILFFVFFARCVRGAKRRSLFFLIPALSYTVAHQGLRFTMFWVLLVAFVIVKDLPERPGDVVPAKA